MSKDKDNNKLLLQIPAYISEIKDVDMGGLFDLRESDIIDKFKRCIKDYNANQEKFHFSRKGKSEDITISEISFEDLLFAEDEALLLRISTEKTNLCGGIIKHNDKDKDTSLNYADKLLIPSNIVVLYPRVIRPEAHSDKGHWFTYVFVYEDPSKPNVDMSQLAHQMLKKVFDTPIRNIKEDKFKNEIKSLVETLQVEIILSNFDDNPDVSLPNSLTKYSVKTKERKETTITIDDLQAKDAVELLDDNTFKGFTQRILKYTTHNNRKLTARITERQKDAKISLERAFEDSFNFSLEVQESDLVSGKLFRTEIVKSNIEQLLKEI